MPKTILVIDDDPDILESVRLMLEDEGFRVRTSLNVSAVLHTEKRLPDLIILDVLLSGEDGRVFCTKLKNTEKTRCIPVIMISAHPTAKQSSRKAGANAFIAKPFEITTLLTAVQNNLKN